MMMRSLLARLCIAIIFAVSGCAADVATLQKRLEPHYRVQRPQGLGPFPAIMLVPGCGGISPVRLRTADELVNRGYVVAFVDYISSRGLQTACGGGVSFDEIAKDITVASSYLRTLPYVRGTSVGVIGWSLGGAGILTNLAKSAKGQPASFSVAAVLYPACSHVQPWKTDVPVLMLLGELDDVAPPEACQELAKMAGPSVTVRTYPEARHSFDASDLPPKAPFPSRPGKTVGYHADVARQAWAEITAKFEQELKLSK